MIVMTPVWYSRYPTPLNNPALKTAEGATRLFKRLDINIEYLTDAVRSYIRDQKESKLSKKPPLNDG